MSNLNLIEYGSQYVTNGYLVATSYSQEAEKIYKGIDDDLWPIESSNYRMLANLLGIPQQMEGVQVATKWEETISYWRRCNDQKINARLLSVSTRYITPCIIESNSFWQHIGYDIADPLGQHSLLKNQVISRSMPPLEKWIAHLNKYGMLSSLETAEQFMSSWVQLANRIDAPPSSVFDFVPVAVSLYTGR